MDKMAYTVPEVAQLLGISRVAAYNLTHVEGFPIIRLGRRIIVPKSGLEKWFEEAQGKQFMQEGVNNV